MSRTRHHKGQRENNCGWDYGARYRCDRTYGQSKHPYGKLLAHREMRADGKLIIYQELNYDLERMNQSLSSPVIPIPRNLSREKKRKLILDSI